MSPTLPRLGRCPIGQRRHRAGPRPRRPGCCGPTSSPATSTSCASRSGPSAARWVENRWSLRWDLPDGRWYDSEVLPHPTCSLTVELGSHPRAGMPAGRGRRRHRRVHAPLRRRGARLGPGRRAALPPRRARRAHRAPGIRLDRPLGARPPRCCPPAWCATLADPDLAASGAGVGRGRRGGPGRARRRAARPALRPAARRRRRHARRPHPARGGRRRRAARRHGAHPAAAVHPLRRGRAEVGARALPHARRRRRPRRRLGRHAHRPRRALRLVRPGPLHPRLHRAGRGHPGAVPRPRAGAADAPASAPR